MASPSASSLAPSSSRPVLHIRELLSSDSAVGDGAVAQYAALMAQGRWVTSAGGGAGAVSLGAASAQPSSDVLLSRWQTMRSSGATVYIAQSASPGQEAASVLGAVTVVRERELLGCRFHVENVITERGHRRQGVGLALLQHAIGSVAGKQQGEPELSAAEAADVQADDVALYVILSASKFGPRCLYARCGFQPCGVQLQHLLSSMDGAASERQSSALSSSGLLIRSLSEQDLPSLFSLLTVRGEEMTGWSRPISQSIDSAGFSRRSLLFLRCPQVLSGQKRVWVAIESDAASSSQAAPVVVGAVSLFFENKLTEGHGRPTAHISSLYSLRHNEPHSSLLLSQLLAVALAAASVQQSRRALLRCSYALSGRFCSRGWELCSQQMFLPLACGQPDDAERQQLRDRSWGLWLKSDVVTRWLSSV
jgi:GNAT superfamily N-acetyltransferase